MSILKLGSKGSAVTELQKLLIKNCMTGKNKKPLIADCDFGENTEYASINLKYQDLTTYIDKESKIRNA